jgi:peptidoglycan-associated lipoprotein
MKLRHVNMVAVLSLWGCACLAVGCGADQKKAAKSPQPVSQTSLTSANPAPKPVSNGLRVSDEIAEKCKLRVSSNVEQAPKFDLNESELTAADKDILQQIATCMTTGPLKGRNVQLVGRADSRGATEYNLSLGAHRADGVDKYLVGLGVAQPRLKATSRGELDATGTDEAGWASDRRVDIGLAN